MQLRKRKHFWTKKCHYLWQKSTLQWVFLMIIDFRGIKCSKNAKSLINPKKHQILPQIIIHVRATWHLRLKPFENMSDFGKKTSLNCWFSLILALKLLKLHISIKQKLFDLDWQDFNTKNVNECTLRKSWFQMVWMMHLGEKA